MPRAVSPHGLALGPSARLSGFTTLLPTRDSHRLLLSTRWGLPVEWHPARSAVAGQGLALTHAQGLFRRRTASPESHADGACGHPEGSWWHAPTHGCVLPFPSAGQVSLQYRIYEDSQELS